MTFSSNNDQTGVPTLETQKHLFEMAVHLEKMFPSDSHSEAFQEGFQSTMESIGHRFLKDLKLQTRVVQQMKPEAILVIKLVLPSLMYTNHSWRTMVIVIICMVNFRETIRRKCVVDENFPYDQLKGEIFDAESPTKHFEEFETRDRLHAILTKDDIHRLIATFDDYTNSKKVQRDVNEVAMARSGLLTIIKDIELDPQAAVERSHPHLTPEAAPVKGEEKHKQIPKESIGSKGSKSTISGRPKNFKQGHEDVHQQFEFVPSNPEEFFLVKTGMKKKPERGSSGEYDLLPDLAGFSDREDFKELGHHGSAPANPSGSQDHSAAGANSKAKGGRLKASTASKIFWKN